MYRDYAVEVENGSSLDFVSSFANEFGFRTDAEAKPWEALFEVNDDYLSGIDLGERVAFPSEAG